MNKILSFSQNSVLLFLLLTAPLAMAQKAGNGSPAAGFTLKDINGNTVSLSDFKGKVVYLDVWASWCRPCLEEIPSAKELHEQFKGDSSIAFVNISVDRDSVRWRTKVTEKQMTGIQLLSLGGVQSDIMKNYEITGIPRFIIIDKEGIIVDYNAKRPSEKALAKSLAKLLAK